ncbi:MAG: lasso peptide [Elainella sp. Prado103]|jgi:hypothetical protein|nr:lasso peptide [Elainella sp. Prado103]
MKKTYSAPQLIVHGNVEQLTQAFGSSSQEDTFYYTNNKGQTMGFPAEGSVDGVVVPKP